MSAGSTSPNHPLGDILHCPVCYELFDGRIMMCHSGHGVCEKCQKMLKECPQCRSAYTGTRNYMMEQLVLKLKKIKIQLEPTSIEEQSKAAVLKANAIAEAAAKKDKGNLAKKPRVNRKNNPIEDNVIPDFFRTLNPTILDNKMMSGNSIISNRPNIADNATIYRKPLQIKGTHLRCQFLNCAAELPICRLYNHIRYFHKDYYTELKPEGKFSIDSHVNLEISAPARNYRHAFKISDFGLFFLKINIKKEIDGNTVYGWVQGTCKNRDARIYKYDIELVLGQSASTYSDLCYGVNQTDEFVQGSGNCLQIATNGNFRFMKINLKVYRWFGSAGFPRSSTTTTNVLQAARANQSNIPRPKNKKKGRGGRGGRGRR